MMMITTMWFANNYTQFCFALQSFFFVEITNNNLLQNKKHLIQL